MKAAILHQLGELPRYQDWADPVPTAGQQLLRVHAASIKQLDKLKVAGRHYTHFASLPTTIGVDGVGVLDDGRRVYAAGVTGMMAEQALIAADSGIVVPDGLSDALAAVLPNALLGSDAALTCRAGFTPGETVLVNGATGVSGQMAVQTARLRGAGTIIATGRNPQQLARLQELGADVVLPLTLPPEQFAEQLERIYRATPLDIVLDYLWGSATAQLLQHLVRYCTHPLRLVTIGQMAGAELGLPSAWLRAHPISLIGSGYGSLSAADVRSYQERWLPHWFEQAADGALIQPVEECGLEDVADAWERSPAAASRLVLLTANAR
ncbi:quinone oxidoreductase family protein [Isoalcanivorax beigongshangi]|uniref:Zinc-binding alcohol dehydrogenase family protein n=1 Tax=Isoalcanivorax beigongshangi TaxID=3238810 RepID=A0ABV4AFI6_9GAMM